MHKHADGSITYTAEEVEAIQYAIERLDGFANGGPWTYEDMFENREDYHQYVKGSQLASGEPWTDKDEENFWSEYEDDDEFDENE